MKVYDYDVDGSLHCREGVATEERPGVLLDTFWTGGDRHRLTEKEALSIRERFDTDDFDELPRVGSRGRWEMFAQADRASIPSQHGLAHRYFVRIGASPDLATQIENARERVAKTESDVRRAESALQWARDDLRALEEKAS